jgi:hypothetical protein
MRFCMKQLARWASCQVTLGFIGLVGLVAGCKTDVHSQLLERELRLQEDQIYCLQDKLENKCYQLDQLADENASLKRQLGIVDSGPAGLAPSPTAPANAARSPTPAAPLLVPPTVEVPPIGGGNDDGPSFSPPAVRPGRSPTRGEPLPNPGGIAPPTLEGVPPLPQESGGRGASRPIRQLSFVESVAGEGTLTHLVINRAKTLCYDANGDGVSEGLTLVVEPRDADERLVAVAGDLTVTVYEPPQHAQQTNLGQPLAQWTIPAAEAMRHFRRTSRARGLHFVLPWPAAAPRSRQVRVVTQLTRFDGSQLEAEAVTSVRSAGVD